MENISPHITYGEATNSPTAKSKGIKNIPDATTLKRMKMVAEKIFEPVRAHFDKSIYISSFYRSPDLNVAIGGSKTSSHPRGEALDMDGDVYGSPTNKQIFEFVRDNLVFDQMIWEFGTDSNPDWVHVSYESTGKQRKQILKAIKQGGSTKYIPYK